MCYKEDKCWKHYDVWKKPITNDDIVSDSINMNFHLRSTDILNKELEAFQSSDKPLKDDLSSYHVENELDTRVDKENLFQ